jgi:putative transcriptional regulator
MSKTLIRWKLNEVMARHRVKGKDLANFLGISTNAVSSLRTADVMPGIGGDRWEQICDGINQLSSSGEKITPFDLIEYIPQEDIPMEQEPNHYESAVANNNS